MNRNPYDYLLPVASSQKFVGRNEIVSEICKELAYLGGGSFAVIGGRRFGKTSFLNAIAINLKKRKRAKKIVSVLPLAIDFKQGFSSAEAFYAFAVKKIEEDILSLLPDLKLPGVRLDKGDEFLSYLAFVEALERVLGILKIHSPARIVFLLDEIDVTLQYPWYLSFFSQLRALISSSSVKDSISLVIFGAHYIYYETKRQDSPLLNVVKPVHLQCVDRSDINALVALGEHCSPECADEVWELSGGHPHLAQYLLHHLWSEKDSFKGRSLPDVYRIAARYSRDHVENLRNWATALAVDGCRVYDILSNVQDWMEEIDIAKKASLPVSETKAALDRLCFQGLARIDGNTYTHYRMQGTLFRNWFHKNRETLLLQEIKAPPADLPSFNPGVHVEHMEFVLGGQQKVSANSIQGDITLESATGLSSAEVGRLFKDIYNRIEGLQSRSLADKSEINKTVKEIEAAVVEGSKDETFFEARLKNLKRMAPDILEVVLTTVGNPLLGLKLISEKIANKLKSESE
jgi:hypothetical protein